MQVRADVDLVHVRVGHAPEATEDADRCDRREYWVVEASRKTLIATDCEQQWGPDTAGPATLVIDGDRLKVHYVEFGANDTCEVYDGIVRLAALAVEMETRSIGITRRNRCEPRAPHPAKVAHGDGSPGRPLLVLHRP